MPNTKCCIITQCHIKQSAIRQTVSTQTKRPPNVSILPVYPQRLLLILMSDFPFNSQHSCFWKTNNVHISDQPWQQQMPISSVTSSVLWFLYASPSRCLCEYNSQIMSSSVMYSQCSVCVDLQATLPPLLAHTRPRSAPGTERRLHLVSQTTKSVRGCLALLLYSVINGSEHPPPQSLCVRACV